MLIGHFWVQAFDLAQQTALCWRPLWTVRGKPLPLPAVKLRRIIANMGRTKQGKNAEPAEIYRSSVGRQNQPKEEPEGRNSQNLV
jgi:hypothetical protein